MQPPSGSPSVFNIPESPTNVGSQGSHSIGQMPVMPPRTQRKVVAKKPKQENFKPEEDALLCQTWVEISSDPVVNTGQRKEGLWSRIVERYNQRRGDYPIRLNRALSSRWDNIGPVVSKFASYYAQVRRQCQSGLNEHDMVSSNHFKVMVAKCFQCAYIYLFYISEHQGCS